MLKSTFLILICAAAVWLDPLVLYGQKENEPAAKLESVEDRYRRLVGQGNEPLGLYDDGVVSHDYTHKQTYFTPIPILELFSDPDVAEELGVVESQRKGLQSQIWKIDQACLDADKVRDKAGLDFKRQATKVLEIIEPLIKRAYELLDEVLIELQLKKLKQVLIQLEISRRGMPWFLQSDYAEALEPTELQKKQWLEVARDFYEDFQKKAVKQRRDFTKQLLEKIPEKNRPDFEDYLSTYNAPLALVALHLDEKYVRDFGEIQQKTRWPDYVGIAQGFYFNVDAVGRLRWYDHSQYLGDIDHFLPVIIIHHCRHGSKRIELSMEQGKRMDQLLGVREQQISLLAEMHSRHVKAYGYEGIDAVQNKIAKGYEALRQSRMKELEKILLDHQKDVIRADSVRVQVTRFGPVAYLLKLANLGSDFSLTRAEKKQLHSFAEARQKSITQFLVKEENRLNRKLLSILTRDQKETFLELVGASTEAESFQFVRGNLEIHEQLAKFPLHSTNFNMISKLIQKVIQLKQGRED